MVNLLANTSALSQQLTGLVADNEQDLAPALEKLNAVTAMLQRNNDNITQAMRSGEVPADPGRGGQQRVLLQRFRRQPQPGADPATVLRLRLRLPPRGRCRAAAVGAGPRAEFPWPYNFDPPGGGADEWRSAAMTSHGTTSHRMTSRGWRTMMLAGLLAVVLAAGAVVLVRNTVLKPTGITAYFTSATAIYPR